MPCKAGQFVHKIDPGHEHKIDIRHEPCYHEAASRSIMWQATGVGLLLRLAEFAMCAAVVAACSTQLDIHDVRVVAVVVRLCQHGLTRCGYFTTGSKTDIPQRFLEPCLFNHKLVSCGLKAQARLGKRVEHIL